LGPIPNPQSPIPNPQSPLYIYLFSDLKYMKFYKKIKCELRNKILFL